MPDDPLANSRERISCELLENIVQTVDRFLSEDPGDRRVRPREVLYARRVHEVHSAVGHRLHTNRRRTADERRRTEQTAPANIADRDLATVAGVHVDAEKALDDDADALLIGLGIDGQPCREI